MEMVVMVMVMVTEVVIIMKETYAKKEQKKRCISLLKKMAQIYSSFTLHVIFEVHFLSSNDHVLLFMSHLHQLENLKEKNKLMLKVPGTYKKGKERNVEVLLIFPTRFFYFLIPTHTFIKVQSPGIQDNTNKPK
jgi:hypothetical protein